MRWGPSAACDQGRAPPLYHVTLKYECYNSKFVLQEKLLTDASKWANWYSNLLQASSSYRSTLGPVAAWSCPTGACKWVRRLSRTKCWNRRAIFEESESEYLVLHSFQVSIWSLSLGLLGFCCDCVLNFPEFYLPRLNERLGASDTGQTPPDLDRTVRVMMRDFEYLKLGRAELPVDFPSQRGQLHSVLESSPLKN